MRPCLSLCQVLKYARAHPQTENHTDVKGEEADKYSTCTNKDIYARNAAEVTAKRFIVVSIFNHRAQLLQDWELGWVLPVKVKECGNNFDFTIINKSPQLKKRCHCWWEAIRGLRRATSAGTSGVKSIWSALLLYLSLLLAVGGWEQTKLQPQKTLECPLPEPQREVFRQLDKESFAKAGRLPRTCFQK